MIVRTVAMGFFGKGAEFTHPAIGPDEASTVQPCRYLAFASLPRPTTVDPIALQIARFTPISLAEMDSVKLQNRVDTKYVFAGRDLPALLGEMQEHYRLLALSQHSEMGERPHAVVAFAAGTEEHHAESHGNGPVDASLKAIESKIQSGAELLLYSVNAITSGSTESQGEVTVRLQLGGRVVNGVGADPDIVVASAKAYLSALNKLHSRGDRVAAQG